MRNLNLTLVDLNLLRVFEAMMRERNVSQAAQRLNLTQPAVSNALARLRAAFDDPLFVRTRAGMEPTAVALTLYEPIEHGLTAIRTALSESVRFDPRTSGRRFTIITTDVGELTFIAELLKILAQEAPHIDLRVMEASSEEYERRNRGHADFHRLAQAPRWRQGPRLAARESALHPGRSVGHGVHRAGRAVPDHAFIRRRHPGAGATRSFPRGSHQIAMMSA
jgi:DNA-binding transcriptional LysR family regulator